MKAELVTENINIPEKFQPAYTNLKKQLLKSYDLGMENILFQSGLGETTTLLQLLYASPKRHQFIGLCTESGRTDLIQNNPYINCALEIPLIFYAALLNDVEFRVHVGLKNYGSAKTLNLGESLIHESFQNRACVFLHIAKHTPLRRYKLYSEKEMEQMEQKFENLGLKREKTVFIVPNALCFGNQVVPNGFWQSLSDRLKSLGYSMVINSKGQIVENVPHVFFSVRESVMLSELSGHVIGVRTGLLDVIGAFSDVKLQAIYPSDDNPIWTENADLKNNYYTGTTKGIAEKSLRGNRIDFLFPGANSYEFVYAGFEETLDRLIQNL